MKAEFFNEERLAKLEKIKDMNVNPYPYGYDVETKIKPVKEDFNAWESKTASIAGRVLSMRKHGKTIFMDVSDETGNIQLFISNKNVKEVAKGNSNLWELINNLDISDIVGVKGEVFKTKMGEISLRVKDLDILAKSICGIPYGKQKDGERWNAVEDVETKYRERYVFWNVYPEERNRMFLRSKIIKCVREFLEGKGFLEVSTPTLEITYGGAEARPFETEIWALGHQKAYLRISPELYLKRYIVSGFPKVFTICQNFRNEGIDRSHNPEFTMMEWYEAFTDYNYQMNQFEELVSSTAIKICGSTKVNYQGKELDFTTPWPRYTMPQAINHYLAWDFENKTDDEIKAFITENELKLEGEFDRNMAAVLLFEELCESKITNPVFVLDHPKKISPLTKEKRGNSELVERFEPFVAGMELGNAYSELTDPQDQLERFIAQRQSDNEDDSYENHPVDMDFVKALSIGMPPTGGVGIGIDRLIMLLTDSANIREITPFPVVKPK